MRCVVDATRDRYPPRLDTSHFDLRLLLATICRDTEGYIFCNAIMEAPQARPSPHSNGLHTEASIEPGPSSLPSLASLLAASSSSSLPLFSQTAPFEFVRSESSSKAHLAAKIATEYKDVLSLHPAVQAQQQQGNANGKARADPSLSDADSIEAGWIRDLEISKGTQGTVGSSNGSTQASTALVRRQADGVTGPASMAPDRNSTLSTALQLKRRQIDKEAKPEVFHPRWKLSRVISGHLGWVRSIALDPSNQWFATGAGDRMIKIWDLASGELKLTLTGHISPVRGLAVSDRHPYLFSCGEDKMVKCWDLEQNKVIRQYHGHLSGIYSLDLHPTLDVLVTAGRDATARVWDMRTKAQVHVLSGHTGTVASVRCQDSDPQIVTGSMDSTVRLWDLAAGKSMTTLTHHKKGIRALAMHPIKFSFASGAAGGNNIKTWVCPEGTLFGNMAHETIVNTMSVNADGVLFSGGDNGSMKFFDYTSGIPFQAADDVTQPGSLDAESGIMSSAFDRTGTRLITGCCDKSIKIWKEES
ncbi:unnamed protein product [Parajaminaea phylloscopi]